MATKKKASLKEKYEYYWDGVFSHWDGSNPEELVPVDPVKSLIDDSVVATNKTWSSYKINQLIESGGVKFKVVFSLPEIGDPTTIYLLVVSSGGTQDACDEYVYAEGKWEKIGSTRVDLSNYYTKGEVNVLLDGKQNTIVDLEAIRSGAALGATSLQSGDSISRLTNDVGYLTTETLPIASTEQLGVIKVGENLTIDENGVLNGVPTTYVAGNHIEISGNTISAIEPDVTVPEVLDILGEDD